MPRVIWKHKLRLEDIFHSEAHSFTNRRDIIVARIRRSHFWDEDDYVLTELVEELADAPDAKTFDRVWNELYDWFDANRVWVATA
jgi:hypothetical protein